MVRNNLKFGHAASRSNVTYVGTCANILSSHFVDIYFAGRASINTCSKISYFLKTEFCLKLENIMIFSGKIPRHVCPVCNCDISEFHIITLRHEQQNQEHKIEGMPEKPAGLSIDFWQCISKSFTMPNFIEMTYFLVLALLLHIFWRYVWFSINFNVIFDLTKINNSQVILLIFMQIIS